MILTQITKVSILPRLATGIPSSCIFVDIVEFLFFPVLRRGSSSGKKYPAPECFYSSPSCDGDPAQGSTSRGLSVSILPRLATGIVV